MDSGKNSYGLGEVSFSSYLGTAKEKSIHKLTESDQYPHQGNTSSPEFHSPTNLERSKNEEGEINIFGAEKYYSMKQDYGGPIIIDTASNHGYKKGNQVDLLRIKTKTSRPGTPSVSSEASWNSQSALLPIYQRNLSQSKHKKVHGSSFFAGLRCNRSCSGKNAVYIEQEVVQSPISLDGRKQRKPMLKVKDEFHKPSSVKIKSVESKKEGFFAPKVGSPGIGILAVKKQLAKESITNEESRKSLDVFGSHMMNKETIEVNLERKVSMLTWDAIPKPPSIPTTSVTSQVCEDIESDASSDLFEIENISSSTGQPLFTRQTSDGMSSCMTPTLYEPSETSIAWSVVTASAADFSIVSDYDEKKLTENVRTPSLRTAASNVANTKSMVDKEVQSSKPSKLLGCKSDKAVRVVETAYKITNEKTKSHPHHPQRTVSPMPVRKLQTNTTDGFDFP